jgi:hypothetical protein
MTSPTRRFQRDFLRTQSSQPRRGITIADVGLTAFNLLLVVCAVFLVVTTWDGCHNPKQSSWAACRLSLARESYSMDRTVRGSVPNRLLRPRSNKPKTNSSSNNGPQRLLWRLGSGLAFVEP